MPDTFISQLPLSSAAADAVVAADSGDGTVTNKVTLASIAALGGGAPASHAATHGSAGTDPITPAAIGAVATNDARLTNARAPTGHASSHGSAGTDPITPAAIGAALASHQHTLSAVTDAGTAASRNVPAVGNASSTEVVLGSDGRLIDSRVPTSHATSHRSTGADAITPVVLTPSLTTSQNDWAPGVADVIYITASGALNITGLAASPVDGFCALLVNVSATANITLAHESTSSTAANRFRSAYGANYVLYADGGSATLVYHAASSRWRIL
jgi:hypothetical protein